MSQTALFASRWAGCAQRLIIATMVMMLAAACVTPPGQQAGGGDTTLSDPLEGMNRHIFAFNEAADTILIRPAVYIYREATPRPLKGILSNFLGNLTLPLTIVHDLLQGKPDHAQIAFGRLVINTFVGVGGMFDIATPAGLPMHSEDMGQTLAVHGTGPGFYLVLPILGPSSGRDAIGTLVDSLADPVTIATYGAGAGSTLRLSRTIASGVVKREQLIEPLDTLRKSLDFYATVRAAYRQRRAMEIRDGEPKPADSESDPFATFDESDKAKPAG